MKWPNWMISGSLMAPEGTSSGTGTGTGTQDPPANGTGVAVKTTITIGGKEYTPEQAQAAISLHNAMSDPDTSKEIVTTLAQRMGITNKDGEVRPGKGTEGDREKLEGKITKVLKQKLGKEYEAFAGLVGPALDEAITELFTEHRGELDSRVSQTTWEQGVTSFMETHNFVEGLEAKMEELVLEAPPNMQAKTFNQSKYLERMYKQACEELGIEVPRAKTRGRSDDEGEERVDTPRIVVRERPKLAAGEDPLDRIVSDAMKGIRYKR